MKTLKKVICLLALFLVICLISSIAVNKNNYKPASSMLNGEVIIIDPGHGGFDGGAVANDGTVEKDINLNISKNVYEILNLFGFDVLLTRETDIGTDDNNLNSIAKRKVSDLKNRLSFLNSYENGVFVSVHMNKFTTSTASGAQVFYSKNKEESLPLASEIQDSIVELIQKNNKRTIKQATKSNYLLYNSQIPAVIVECGFLSNYEELKKLKEDNYQKQISYAIFDGILKFKMKEE